MILSPEYGKCDKINCSHHYSPYEYPPDSNGSGVCVDVRLFEEKDYYHVLPVSLFRKSFSKRVRYTDNLSLFLLAEFPDKQRVKDVLTKYGVGCSTLFKGKSTVFWQISADKNLRTGKIMKYTEEGKRDKEGGYPKMNWAHTFYKGDYELEQCLFGDHLLTKEKKVRVFESEKTAIIMSIVDQHKDKYVNIATGGLYNLTEIVLERLKPYDVTFFPDKGKAFYVWEKKVEENKGDSRWKMSTILEEDIDLKDGDDMADKYFFDKTKFIS